MKRSPNLWLRVALTAFTGLYVYDLSAATNTWSGASGTDTNWSNAANWTGGLPGSGDDAKFASAGAATATNLINNVVDATTTVASLQFNNLNYNQNPTNAHTTLIGDGQTLNVTGAGGLLTGTGTDAGNTNFIYAIVKGAGALNVNNTAALFVVNQGLAANGNNFQRAVLNLSGLDTLSVNVSRFDVGVAATVPGGAQNVTGTLYLAKTNTITTAFSDVANITSGTVAVTTNAFEVGANNGNAGGVNFLYLGQANTINADSIGVGKLKTTSTMLFNPIFTTPIATFRGAGGGASRVKWWLVGDMASSGSSSSFANGTNDFTGGTLDALVDTMSLGRDRQGGNTGTTATRGNFIYTAGTLDVNTLILGNQAFTAAGNVNPMQGLMNVVGSGATLVVNSSLILGNTTASSTAARASFGILNLTNSTLRANSVVTGLLSTNNTINFSNALVTVTNTIGTPAKGITRLTLADSTLKIFVTGVTNVSATNVFTGGATNIIQPLTVAVFSTYPAQIPLIKYTGSLGGAGYNFGFGGNALPASAPDAYLTNNTLNASVDLVLPTDPRPVITAQPASYSGAPGDNVTFTVTATGVNPLAYQWRLFGTNLADGATGNGSTLSGANSAALALTGAQAGDNGDYSVVITNLYGATTSSPAAVLTISAGNVAPSISGPNNQTVVQGNNATFTASVAGVPAPDLQWYKNGVVLPGETGASLTILNAQYPADAATYSLVATNVAGAQTNSATLTVQVPVAITTQPTNLTVLSGAPATFYVAATGVPAPSFQWRKNGTPISGETGTTLSLPATVPGDAAVYSVVVTNAAGPSYNLASANATLLVTSTTLGIASLAPTNGASGICVDSVLRLTFTAPPTLGTAGRIRIYNLTNPVTPVDTIDLGASAGNGSQLRSIAGNNLNTYPVIISGNTATIFPHLGVLTTNQSYFVTIENVLNGAFKDATGATFAGINDSTTWQFTTKTVNPSTSATTLTVAADGSGDFCTVQGVLDLLPANNTTPRTINIKNGTYQEIVRLGSKHNLTFKGESQAGTVIAYPNNDALNSGTAGRPMFRAQANDLVFADLTLTNSTPKGGTQAEALRIDGLRHIYTNVFLASFQDTLLINNVGDSAYFINCLIQGDTDFIWGGGTPYFQNTEIRALNAGHNTQMRTDAAHFGAVFADCYISKTNGATFTTHTLGRGIGSESDNGNCAYLNCRMDNHLTAAGWLSGAANTATLRYWEYQSMQTDGITPVDVSGRAGFSVQLSSSTALAMRNLTNVLAGWLPAPALHVDSNPVSQTVYAGANVSFSATAGGVFAPNYQWQHFGTNLPGQTSATLNLTGVSAADAGSYSCLVSNVNAMLSSAAATLTVITPVAPVSSGVTILGDGNVQFSISGGDGQNYRVWASTNVALTPVVSAWTQIGSGTFGATPVSFADLQATNHPQRYYIITVP